MKGYYDCDHCGQKTPNPELCDSCGAIMPAQPAFAGARLTALKALSDHAWYGKVLKQMSEAEFDLVVELIEEHGDLDRNEWTVKINRLYLDQPNKPKRLSLLQDVLMACRGR